MNDQEIREAIERLENNIGKKEDVDTVCSVVKQLLAVKGSGVLPEKTEFHKDFRDDVVAARDIKGYNSAIDETALKLAKFLSGLQKKIGELLYYRICEDGVSINLPPDMSEKLYCNVLAKDITDHIKKEMG